ncbi:hypothetical protein Tco_1285392 [Tanacetum coccineum]
MWWAGANESKTKPVDTDKMRHDVTKDSIESNGERIIEKSPASATPYVILEEDEALKDQSGTGIDTQFSEMKIGFKSQPGVFSRSPKETARIVAGWFSINADELKKMSENALKLAQPEAVFDIVRDIHDLAGQREPLADVPYIAFCSPLTNTFTAAIAFLHNDGQTLEALNQSFIQQSLLDVDGVSFQSNVMSNLTLLLFALR